MGRKRERSSGPTLLRMLRDDAKLLAIAEVHRVDESLEALAARFATSHTSADKAFAQMRMDMEYRGKHDLPTLAAMPARQVFPSEEAQVCTRTHARTPLP